MKSIRTFLAAFSFIAIQSIIAQTSLPLVLGAPDEMGPNYKLWNGNGVATPVHGHRVMELASGMHYWNGSSWADSEAAFTPTADGFSANEVQDQVTLAGDLNTVGAVNVVTLNGTRLSSTPVGISLYDPTTGNSEVIAVITNSTGVLISSNQVMFSDCLSGGACADIIYSLEKGSFSQDVIFKGRLDPTDYGFPTNSRIQIITEFFQAPQPLITTRPLYVEQNQTIRSQKVSPDLIDQVLAFDEFVMGTGSAYTYPNAGNTNGTEAVVTKEFKTVQGRTFLIESVDSPAIRQDLLSLPPCGGGTASSKPAYPVGKAPANYAVIPRPQTNPAKSANVQQKRTSQTASVTRKSGVVIDYTGSINSGTSVLKCDTTYHVTGQVYIYNAITIEGGAVIKYDANTSLQLNSSVTCTASMFHPTFFTAAVDNTVGETVSPGTINPSGYANPALLLSFNGSPVLNNLHFSYCKQAIQFLGGNVTANIVHSQFIQCVQGIDIVIAGGSGSGSGSGGSISLCVKNALFSYVNTPLTTALGSGAPPASFYYCTFDHSQYVFSENGYPVNVYDSIFANNSYLTGNGAYGVSGNNNGFYNSPTFGTPIYTQTGGGPFASPVGGGYYYLDPASGFQNCGTSTGLPAGLTNDLAQRTTVAPAVWNNAMSQDTVWQMTAPRDNDGALDLGYHYDPLDYLVSRVDLSSTLTVPNGVAVGIAGSYGFNVLAGANISSVGTPNLLNEFCYYGNVQESRTNTVTPALMQMNGTPNSSLWFRFTDIAMGAGNVSGSVLSILSGGSGTLALRDCQIRGCSVSLAPADLSNAFTFAATNNLFQRCAIGLTRSAGVPFSCYLYNNLFLSTNSNASFNVNYAGSASNPQWNIQDNLFDGTSQTVTGSSYLTCGNNGFASGSANVLGGQNCKTGITSYYNAGPLGNYYYPSNGALNSLAALINAGSTTADQRGLYHYTTITNQLSGLEIKETNSVVDIGYHYVAVSANCLPIDSNSDGVPDYLEDGNGNGLVDNGEVPWLPEVLAPSGNWWQSPFLHIFRPSVSGVVVTQGSR